MLVQAEDDSSNDFVAKSQVIETATSLNYVVVRPLEKNFKVRQKNPRGALQSGTET